MSPKDALAEVLYRSGMTRRLFRPAADLLVVFGYHRIRPDGDAFETPFDDGVFGPTVARFRQQLLWLKENTRILSEDELVDVVESGAALDGPASVVTFDDGYRDNHALALPVLEELGVPATFFIPTEMIDGRRLGWWDLIPYFLKRTSRTSVELDGREHRLGDGLGAAIEHFHQRMKLEPADKTRDLLDRLAAACEVPFPTAETQDAELMSWDEIHDASRRGVTIGSHSHSHRVLRTLDRGSIDQELRSSKATLEEKTGRTVKTLAYPCGEYQHFDHEAREAAAAAGYRLAFSFNTGIEKGHVKDAFDVRRLGASASPSRLAAITVFPGFFAWSS